MRAFHHLLDFHFRGLHRLETLPMLPLGCSCAEATSLYGEPTETKTCDDSPQILSHRFAPGEYHEVVALEYEDKIQLITYWSVKSDPGRDLDHVLKCYRGESSWKEWETGYRYMRADQQVHLWCSALPAIGVAYLQFTSAKTKMETAYRIDQLGKSDDIIWAKNDVIYELQRQFVEEGNIRLLELASRSHQIAVSGDGRNVLILRRQRAIIGPEGVNDWNTPPRTDEDSSRLVLNWFAWSPTGSHWSKSGLPRDAVVSKLQSEERGLSITIESLTTKNILTFEGTFGEVKSLMTGASGIGPQHDDELWARLTNASTRQK